MGNPSREAWDALTEADFIHSCDCIVCKSLRDDSGRSCSGCAVHHVANKALRARVEVLEKVAIDVDEAMRGDYHREGTKIRIVVTQESLNRFRAALDALKEGKG